MKKTIVGALALLCMTVSVPALAQEHDGFQFRGALGVGGLNNTNNVNDVSVGGFAGNVELYLGGYAIPRLAFGGFMSDTVATNPTITSNNVVYNTEGVSMGLFSIGPYMDVYLTPGLHVLLQGGWARLTVSYNGVSVQADGYSVGAGLGYDWHVSQNWRLGFLAKFNAGSTTYQSATDTTLAPTIALSVSYH